jgi:hypothetical protein
VRYVIVRVCIADSAAADAAAAAAAAAASAVAIIVKVVAAVSSPQQTRTNTHTRTHKRADIIAHASGSAKIVLASHPCNTELIVCVKAEITEPHADTPNRGLIECSVEW